MYSKSELDFLGKASVYTWQDAQPIENSYVSGTFSDLIPILN